MFTALGQLTDPIPIKIVAKDNRTNHGKPPFAIGNQNDADLGRHHESRLVLVGITRRIPFGSIAIWVPFLRMVSSDCTVISMKRFSTTRS